MSKEKIKVKIYAGNGTPLKSQKQNRNDKCRCGSDKKVKKCCGEFVGYFSKKVKD